ncbi:hypothetical protein ABTM79_18975, partial [Acinetobacter baumannii]
MPAVSPKKWITVIHFFGFFNFSYSIDRANAGSHRGSFQVCKPLSRQAPLSARSSPPEVRFGTLS